MIKIKLDASLPEQDEWKKYHYTLKGRSRITLLIWKLYVPRSFNSFIINEKMFAYWSFDQIFHALFRGHKHLKKKDLTLKNEPKVCMVSPKQQAQLISRKVVSNQIWTAPKGAFFYKTAFFW